MRCVKIRTDVVSLLSLISSCNRSYTFFTHYNTIVFSRMNWKHVSTLPRKPRPGRWGKGEILEMRTVSPSANASVPPPKEKSNLWLQKKISDLNEIRIGVWRDWLDAMTRPAITFHLCSLWPLSLCSFYLYSEVRLSFFQFCDSRLSAAQSVFAVQFFDFIARWSFAASARAHKYSLVPVWYRLGTEAWSAHVIFFSIEI